MSLTLGELRYIDESTNSWRMALVAKAADKGIREFSSEVENRMVDLSEEYKDAFKDFYEKAKAEDPTKDSVEIQNAFDEEYHKSHPEFYEFEV